MSLTHAEAEPVRLYENRQARLVSSSLTKLYKFYPINLKQKEISKAKNACCASFLGFTALLFYDRSLCTKNRVCAKRANSYFVRFALVRLG